MLTPEQLAELHRRHKQGEPWVVLASEVGHSRDYVRKVVYDWRRHGGPSPQPLLVSGTEQIPTTLPRDELLDRLLDALTATQTALYSLDDRKPVVTIELPDTKPSMLVTLGDTHVGGSGVDHRQMVADMELIRDTPGIHAVHLGDHGDQFSPRVIPAGMLEQLANPDMQWELVELFFRRHLTTAKLLAGVEGNHDAFAGAVGLSPCREMYRRLGVHYLGHGGRVWLKLGTETFKLELRHDFPFKSSLNTTNSQRRLSELTLGADVVALGHLHFPDMQFIFRGGLNQVWLRCSTYKLRDAYAESKGLQMGYNPTPPDMPGVVFWPDQHKLLPFRNFRDGLHTLSALRG